MYEQQHLVSHWTELNGMRCVAVVASWVRVLNAVMAEAWRGHGHIAVFLPVASSALSCSVHVIHFNMKLRCSYGICVNVKSFIIRLYSEWDWKYNLILSDLAFYSDCCGRLEIADCNILEYILIALHERQECHKCIISWSKWYK